MPKISVIMGAYNVGNKKILEKTINPILNQTYKDFEFIICDDGSTDNTLDIISNICQNDKRVRIIKNNKNKGLTYSLNHCLKYAKGEYIARMDADDESTLDRFEKQLKFLEENLEYTLVSTCINLFDDNGIWGERKYNAKVKKEDFLFNTPIAHPAVFAKKEAFDCVNNYNDVKYTNRNEDYDIFMRMFANGVKMYIMPEKLLNFREDKNTFKRRKYKYRINEAIVRYKGFKKLKIHWYQYIYVLKPLIVGLIPQRILKLKQRTKK